jgi:hypothetical protein
MRFETINGSEEVKRLRRLTSQEIQEALKGGTVLQSEVFLQDRHIAQRLKISISLANVLMKNMGPVLLGKNTVVVPVENFYSWLEKEVALGSLKERGYDAKLMEHLVKSHKARDVAKQDVAKQDVANQDVAKQVVETQEPLRGA